MTLNEPEWSLNEWSLNCPHAGPIQTFPTCGNKVSGSVEFQIDAFSGRLYVFIDYYWWGSWERAVDFTILNWNGKYAHTQLLPAVGSGTPGPPVCSASVWRENCYVPPIGALVGRRLLDSEKAPAAPERVAAPKRFEPRQASELPTNRVPTSRST